MTRHLDIRFCEPTAVEHAWDALADRVGGSPFVRPGWALPWHAAYGKGRLMVLTAFDGHRLVAAMPLELRRGVASSPTNWHTPEYEILAEDEQARTDLVGAAVQTHGQRLQLAFVDDELVEQVSRTATRERQRVLSRVLEQGPYIDLEGTFADYERKLDKHMRAELRRRQRRLEERGSVDLTICESADDDALSRFFTVEAAGWKGANGTAIDAEPPTRSFYTSVAHWAGERGWLRLALLSVDGRAVAGDFALQYGDTHYLLKTGFDPEFRRYGAGKLLRRSMIERAFTDGARRYEFLGIADPWKLEWTSSLRRQLIVQAFARSAVGRLDWLAHQYGRPVAKAALAKGRQWRKG